MTSTQTSEPRTQSRPHVWTVLNPLHDESYALSKSAAKIHKDINSRISALLAARAEFDAEGESLASLSPANFKGEHVVTAQARPAKLTELLRSELEIRQAVDAQWWPVRWEERQKAAAMASLDHQKATDDVRALLVSIGYVDGLIPGGNQNCITPDMIFRHPRVAAAKAESLSKSDFAHNTHDLQVNKAAIERLDREITERIQRAVQGV